MSPIITIRDDAIFEPLVTACLRDFPGPEWDGWIRYLSPGEYKLAANRGLPESACRLIDALNVLCPSHLHADPTLHGAGLHCIPPGGFLDVHLDCTDHPEGWKRAMNAILFLDWLPDSGGLEFYERPGEKPCVVVQPAFNRLVTLETTESAYHGVTVRTASMRRSVAVYWWRRDDGACRKRAQFFGFTGDGKDEWRKERAE